MPKQKPSDSDKKAKSDAPADSKSQPAATPTEPVEPYEPPQLVKYEKLEKLIVSGE